MVVSRTCPQLQHDITIEKQRRPQAMSVPKLTIIPNGCAIDDKDESFIVTSIEPNSSCACSHDLGEVGDRCGSCGVSQRHLKFNRQNIIVRSAEAMVPTTVKRWRSANDYGKGELPVRAHSVSTISFRGLTFIGLNMNESPRE